MAECLAGCFIGTDFSIEQDLSGQLPGEWRQFKAAFIPVFLAKLDDNQRLRWALLAVPSISFYRNRVSFKLIKH